MSAEQREYSFCESVTATSISPWCIRPLTTEGRKPGGGVDTPSLCGRVKEKMGWDLEIPFGVNHPKACPGCIERYNILTGQPEEDDEQPD